MKIKEYKQFGAYAILIKNKRILLIKKHGGPYDGKLDLPGGTIEFDERPEEALKRELKEELDLIIKDCNYVGILENFFTNRNQEKTHEIDIYYIINLNNLEINKINLNKIEKENDIDIYHHLEWIDKNDLKNYNLVPNKIKEIILNNEEYFHYVNY